ncbi:MAG: biotin synthase BioB [Gammaproteobacteria bacterium]|nr:biotin synthase BioB [Gammaproteobacteria bacterium]
MFSESDYPIRHDWSKTEIQALFELPFNDLLHYAQSVHRHYFNPNEVQLSTLINIKSGGCPEDCSYCPQSARYNTEVEAEALIDIDGVLESARKAKANGASRFCMGAAWRSPKEKDFARVLQMVTEVKGMGLETCATLGMLDEEQAQRLKKSGLDFYNHNIDTSEEFYEEIISTRTYQDRLNTLENVRKAEMSVCCGGIVGMGEGRADREGLLFTLSSMPKHPESVPINLLVQVEGTPLAETAELDPFEFVRTVAVARILMPASHVRLSAGRSEMDEALQALCFHAGANSIFYGEKLLTTENPEHNEDLQMFERLGISAAQ